MPGFADPVSSLTHLIGAGGALLAGLPLLARGGAHGGRAVALAVFVTSCVFLLAMSGTYHLLADGTTARYVLRHLDHAAIFVLIAGTFTPIHVILFRGRWRWGMLLLIWGIAATAIALKTVFFGAMPEWMGLTIYLAMGWIGAMSGIALWRRFGYPFVRPLVWGAAAYTAGAVIDFAGTPAPWPGVIGAHELFHLAVLAGIACHWSFVARIAPGHEIHRHVRDDCPRARAATGGGP